MGICPQELMESPLSAVEILARVQRLYAQLQLLTGERGTNRQSAAYTKLEAEIRVWADRYSKISGATESAVATVR